MSQRGILFVISAPSGAGKSTLASKLLEAVPGLEFSVSYTTRPRRPHEADGRDYHFIQPARFEQMAREDRFLEWAEVHGEKYGTGRAATENVLARGCDLLLDIDVQGAAEIRRRGVAAVSIFILPPDFATLEARLRARSLEDGGEVDRRLTVAGREAGEFGHYDYLVINDDLERAFEDLRAVVRAERRRVLRCADEAHRILATIPGP
jgi:guanylate kinase